MSQQQQYIEENVRLLTASPALEEKDIVASQEEQKNLSAHQPEMLKLCRQVQLAARFRRFHITVIVPCALLMAIIALLNIWWTFIPASLPVLMAVNIFQFISLGVMGGVSSRAKRALERLKQKQDLVSVGSLLEALPDPYIREGAMEALTVLLPRLQASDAPQLKEHHHRLLAQALKRSGHTRFLFTHPTNRKFAVAALKALEQVGTSQALPVVEFLAQKAPEPEVQRAAQECLPFLLSRAEQDWNEQTLLRASQSHAAPKEELLRPIAGQSNQAEPQQLLRPTLGE